LFRRRSLILIAIILGISFWIFDAFLDSTLLKVDSNFSLELFSPEIYEIWVRCFVFFLLIGFALYSSAMLEKRRRVEEEIRLIVDGAMEVTGVGFFKALVVKLSEHFDSRHAMVGEFVKDSTSVETIAVRTDGEIVENFSYSLKGTPCEELLREQECFHPSGVTELFPEDKLLTELAVESYRGMALHDSDGSPAGLMAIMDDKPMNDERSSESMMRVLSGRAASELMLWRAERDKRALVKELKRALDGNGA
jgi:hypothetical protein